MMAPPPPTDPMDSIAARLAVRLRLARWVLAWERLWPVLLPPLGIAGLFIALALFDVLPLLPSWLHAFLLAVFAVIIVVLGWRGLRGVQWPAEEEAARRLERDSGLTHRPLAALSDHMATDQGDPHGQALWRAHKWRMAALAAGLRLSVPSPGMAARDPLGLRAAILLLLVVAAAAGWHDAPARLARAVSPPIGGLGLAATVEVWVTPPAYTGLPPSLLRPGSADESRPVIVPAGSTVMAALSGGWGGATLTIGNSSIGFQRLADGGQRVETRIDGGTQLAVRQAFRSIVSWPIRVVKDALPSIEFTGTPAGGEHGRLRIAVAGSDDYGIAKAWVEIRRVGAPSGEAPLTVQLPLPAGNPRSVELSGWHDLTSHPWAGLPVSLLPMVQDTGGQIAGGEPVTITLPQRVFHDPVARALIEERRRITENSAKAPEAAAVLSQISVRPALFHDDLAAFLDMRLARAQLSEEQFDLGEVQELLWNAAVRIEDGALGSAERALADARDALQRALNGNASTAELQRLLDQYQAAMRQVLQALARQGETPGDSSNAAGARVIDEDELKRMLDAMHGLAETGSRDALRKMLDELSNLMAGLRRSSPGFNNQAGQAAEGLRDLAHRQQNLLDRSFQQAHKQQASGGAPKAAPGSPGQNSRNAAQAQSDLGRRLEEVTRQLGRAMGRDLPQGLTDAGEWMGRAAGELEAGHWENAANAQAHALENLREALAEAVERMESAGDGSLPRDPLGRVLPGGGWGDDGVRIPAQSEVQRSRQILDELRRRAGERQRSAPERDYLHRLLEPF